MLVSFNMASNRPDNFTEFCANVEETVFDEGCLEVLVLIDDGDGEMKACVDREKERRGFAIKELSRPPRGYFNLWQGLNELHKLCNPDAYFVCNVNDEIRIETKNWDQILDKYVGFFSDDIFRLRTSQFKLRNYQDFWECGYAPENYAFYTKKWIDVAGGDWNACHGPDAYQQFIAFYLWNSEYPAKEQYYRDYPLMDIELTGEGAFLDLSEEQFADRVKKGWVAWYRMVSHKMQEEAKRRALCLKAHIVARKLGHQQFKVVSNSKTKEIELLDDDDSTILSQSGLPLKFSYKLSWLRITLINILRRPVQNYYCGGGKEILLETILNVPFVFFPFLHPKGLLRRYTVGVLHRIFRPKYGVSGFASNSASHAPAFHLCDGTINPWGSAETDEDTYFYLVFKRKIQPKRIEIILHSPASRAHLRDVSVVAKKVGQEENAEWMVIKGRRDKSDEFSEKITIPPSADYTREIIELAPELIIDEGFRVLGLACLSATKNHKRNYLTDGRGIYIRNMIVR